MQKLHIFFSAKNINVFAIFQDRNYNITFANNLLSFEQLGPEKMLSSHLHFDLNITMMNSRQGSGDMRKETSV